MFDRFSGPNRTIVAGIEFTEHDHNFAKSVNQIAARTGMSVHLLHVIEPWTAEYSNAFFPGEYTSSKIAEFAEIKRLQRAEEKLQELTSAFSKEVKVTHSVEIGSVPQMLSHEANRQRASMIICSVSPTSHKFVPKIFSTPLTLMAESSVPVMVIPNDIELKLDDRQIRLMVCDNLEEASRAAVGTATELGLAFGRTDLVHLHVYPKSTKELEKWADEVMTLMTEHKIRTNERFTSQRVIENTESDIKSKLGLRLGFEKDLLETRGKGTYSQVVKFGDVDENIMQVADKEKPDIVVFGRHHLLHKRPFTIGRVPFAAMLSLHRPVLMVPSTLQLL